MQGFFIREASSSERLFHQRGFFIKEALSSKRLRHLATRLRDEYLIAR